jgi:hypothetical protein
MIAYLCEVLVADHPPPRQLQESIYANDHLPAHFHIEGRSFRAIVEIETMVVRAGDVHRAREALTWAETNIELLRSKWLRLNRRR